MKNVNFKEHLWLFVNRIVADLILKYSNEKNSIVAIS